MQKGPRGATAGDAENHKVTPVRSGSFAPEDGCSICTYLPRTPQAPRPDRLTRSFDLFLRRSRVPSHLMVPKKKLSTTNAVCTFNRVRLAFTQADRSISILASPVLTPIHRGRITSYGQIHGCTCSCRAMSYVTATDNGTRLVHDR